MKTVLLPTKGEWKTATLGEVCSDVFSGGTPKTSENGYYGGDIPWLRTQEVNFNYIEDTELKITEEGFKNSSAQWTPANTVIIAMYGNSAGRSAFSRIPLTTNQACCNLIVNKEIANPLFVYFAVKNQYKSLESLANGGAQQNLNASIVKNFVIPLPPLSEQEGIVKILSSLDDKIELLRQQNETLEQIARTAFEEKFLKGVDIGNLSVGWKMGTINDLICIFSGFAFKSAEFDAVGQYKLATIKNVQDGYFVKQTTDHLAMLPSRMPQYCLLQTGDILLSLTGNVGRVCYVVGDNYLLNQRVAMLKPRNKIDLAYTYMFFRQSSMLETLGRISSGTAQQNLSPIKTGELITVVPARDTLDAFAEMANPLLEKMQKNSLQVEMLASVRDAILPKLMGGEVRVQE